MGNHAPTLVNNPAGASVGFMFARWLTGQTFQIIVALAFLAMAGWALIPDKEDDGALDKSHGGVFLTTLIAFFFVEIGDKTQIATSLLAARYHEIALVTAGTTLGMMIANVPAVLMGEAATRVVPLNVVRIVAAAIFGLIGIWVLLAALRLI
jgi:putative Ca2+/H+ antiporter (TMEM165/GDT1 family)